METERFNVLYTCDDNYVWLMGISMISLLENNRDIPKLQIYLLGERISEQNRQIIAHIAESYGRSIEVIDVPVLAIPEKLVSKRWPLSAFTRLFAAQLLPEDIGKILYLDCDTVVVGTIRPLMEMEMGGYAFLGVKDCISGHYKRNTGLDRYDSYINAGVLLINLAELGKINVREKIEKYLENYALRISYADQDILNGLFHEKTGVLEPQYNVMTITVAYSVREIYALRRPVAYYGRSEIRKAVKQPVIIHYTTNLLTVRPWYQNSNHPFKEVFLKYKDMSPWKDRETEPFVFSGREAAFIRLVQRLPGKMANRILGCVHARIKPGVVRLKAGVRRRMR